MIDKSRKYLCIHGHFYQPPRENAWLEIIEQQDSAAPFHDWNERINFECYAPNTKARILDQDRFITNIVNNYSKISFNFGPTLLSWMKIADPETYEAIIEADVKSRAQFGGHGSALAQVHGHLIMPLANRRDKETQVKWGIRDFESRFNRLPEGIWLAETAVDTETLEILVDHNIRFTILAPRQAKAFRRSGEEHWTDLPFENIDPRRPYRYNLPSGRYIDLFFYHGEIAQSVAFKGLLYNGKNFANYMTNAFDQNDTPQLVHIATDGESYGHHHNRGEMALADAISHIESNQLAHITNYGQYLDLFPVEYEVQIHEDSSWSCVHGVERWRSNCGCNTGGRPTWNQNWRAPLRDTLNWLRDELIPVFEAETAPLLHDPWAARNDYVDIILDRTPESVQKFMDQHAKVAVDSITKTKILRLMEMQRQSMQMFTSCGWFFDEVSGIETNQILQYANRAMYYTKQVSGKNFHDEFIARLEKTPSNVYSSAAESYRHHVLPTVVDLKRVAMHYAASALFEEDPENLELFNYRSESEVFEKFRAGNQMLALGRTTIHSKITYSEKPFTFAVLYLGQQHIIGNISIDMDWNQFVVMSDEIIRAFRSSDLGQVIGVMQSYFDSEKFTIWNLFQEEKRKIIDMVTQDSLRDVETNFRNIYRDNYQLMSSMVKSDIPLPEAYVTAVKYILNLDLSHFFKKDQLKIRELKRLLGEMKKWNVSLTDTAAFKLSASERIFKEIESLHISDESLPKIQLLNEILTVIQDKDYELEIWKSQNEYFSILAKFKSQELDYPSLEWLNSFAQLGDLLKVRS